MSWYRYGWLDRKAGIVFLSTLALASYLSHIGWT